ncbi:MAG: uroporphyrinogen decarboxylase [Hyphomicrobiales bacterium]|nr:uroporphyrinogen decarboxylase [Hyphomicrobiales bacterium]
MRENSTKKLLSVLQGHISEIPPVWLMRQAGRYLPEYREIRSKVPSFLDLCYTPDLATEVTLQPIRRFGFDAAILFSDILVVPHGLGCHVAFQDGEGPVVQAITGEDDFAILQPERVTEHLVPVYEAVRNIRTALPESVTLIGFAGAPWTVATYMLEGKTSKQFQTAKKFAYQRPDLFQKLLDILVESTAQHLIFQAKAGAEVLQIFDSWAGVVPAPVFDAWIVAPTHAIVEKVQATVPGIPIIGFPKGVGLQFSRYAKQTGITAIGLDYTVPVSYPAEQLPQPFPVQGNLDPVQLLASKEGTIAGVRKIKQAWKDRPYILNLGHGILPSTPISHVETLIETVRNNHVG